MSDSGLPRSSSGPGPTPAPAGAPAYDRASEVGIDDPRYDQTARDDPPRVRYVICATQRSGSFLLARQLLNAGLGVPQEYFHPLHADALAGRWGVSPADRAGYVRVLLRRRTTPNGVWGTKLQWWQYRDWRAELDALVLGGAKILYLYRSDVAAQAVSLHLSHATGVWGPDGAKTTAGEPPERLRDVAGVREAEAMIRAETAAWEQYFADRRVEPLVLRYEDFVADQPGTVERVARFLGLSAGEYRVPPAEPKATSSPPEVEAARADLLRRHREGGEPGGLPPERPSASPATPPRPAIRGASVPLPAGFPRFQAYVVTVAARGKTPVVFIDLDLTALLPAVRTARTLEVVGEQFDVRHLKTPGELRDRQGRPILPGYTQEAWMGFLAETGLPDLYPYINWNSPDRDNHGSRQAGELYAAFRAGYWQQDLRTDEVSPGLPEFIRLVEARHGKAAFLSGRPGTPDDSLFSLKQGGIPDPLLYFGQQSSGLPVPREHVRDGDADTKFVRTKEAEARGEAVVAVVDDRASNRAAVVAATTHGVISIAIAAPGFSYTPDAADPTAAYRLSSFILGGA